MCLSHGTHLHIGEGRGHHRGSSKGVHHGVHRLLLRLRLVVRGGEVHRPRSRRHHIANGQPTRHGNPGARRLHHHVGQRRGCRRCGGEGRSSRARQGGAQTGTGDVSVIIVITGAVVCRDGQQTGRGKSPLDRCPVGHPLHAHHARQVAVGLLLDVANRVGRGVRKDAAVRVGVVRHDRPAVLVEGDIAWPAAEVRRHAGPTRSVHHLLRIRGVDDGGEVARVRLRAVVQRDTVVVTRTLRIALAGPALRFLAVLVAGEAERAVLQAEGGDEACALGVHHLDRLAAGAEGTLAMQGTNGRIGFVGGGVGDKGVALSDVQLVRHNVAVRAEEVQQVVWEELAEGQLTNEDLSHR